MKQLLITFILILFTQALIAQTTGAKSNFYYRITKKKLAKLKSKSIFITDGTPTASSIHYQLCATDKVFKVVINAKDGILKLDPWTYIRTNAVCDSVGIIGKNTPADKLQITVPNRKKLSDLTWAVTLPYRSLVISVNTLQLKIRPGVTDYANNKWSGNAITGTYNLGVNLGYSFGWTNFTVRSSSNYSVTPGINFGFGSASLAKEPLKRMIDTKYTPSNAVFSPAISCVFARNDIGIILALGPDYMLGRDHDAWALQGKWTFGLGVNAGFKL